MLTNPEDSSQPADISQSPPAADAGGSPSQLLGAFVDCLRGRPTIGASESAGFDDGSSEMEGVTRGITELGGVPAITLQPQVGNPARTVLYFHGGGYVSGSPPERYLPLAAAVALAANARVHVVDYRLAPEAPFPGAFDDCLHAYQWLVTHGGADPRTLVALGDSAGGNLAVAVIAAARDGGLALPAGIALVSPLADLTLSGASIEERKHLDPLVTRQMLESTVTDYLAGADPCDPRCSAIFADMRGFPPMLIPGRRERDPLRRCHPHPRRLDRRGCQRSLRVVATWNPRLAGVYLCRTARIRRRRRTPGNLLQNPSRTLGVGNIAVIDLPLPPIPAEDFSLQRGVHVSQSPHRGRAEVWPPELSRTRTPRSVVSWP
jgi:acetyl esterase/lipase